MRTASIAVVAMLTASALFAEDRPDEVAANPIGELSDTSSYKEVMASCDTDKDGLLSPEEIAAVTHAGTKAKLQSFDVDGDGALGKSELATLRQNWRARDQKPEGDAKPAKKPKGETDEAKPGKKPKGEAKPEGGPEAAQPGE